MKRYYYTDPLAAAWMAKHYGMKFNHPDNESFPALTLSDAIDVFMNAGEGDKLHIHPDSLNLLEPQVHDTALYWHEREPDYFSQSTAKRTTEHVKRITKKVLFFIKHQRGIKNLRIIQRHGIPFMWPEVEA